ncbi:MAG: hypothetical protein EF812_03125 [Methanosarcinales archaeon]|nr:MAG: hypothetical protein EF812_03125 [Methanosarcinales archaeon]
MKEEDKINKEENPLSPADWIVFLSGEISNHRTRFLTYAAMILAVLLVCLSVSFGLVSFGLITLSDKVDPESFVCGIILTVLVIVSFVWFFLSKDNTNKKVKPLENIRDQILCGDLKEYDEIYKEYRCVKRFT